LIVRPGPARPNDFQSRSPTVAAACAVCFRHWLISPRAPPDGRIGCTFGDGRSSHAGVSRRKAVREKSNFALSFNGESAVQSCREKYLSSDFQYSVIPCGRSSPPEGRRDRHGRWAGNAVDAGRFARRARRARTQKSYRPGLPTLRSSCARRSRHDGGKKARSPGRVRRTALKPSRRECRMIG
jgi:hypothetical protein